MHKNSFLRPVNCVQKNTRVLKNYVQKLQACEKSVWNVKVDSRCMHVQLFNSHALRKSRTFATLYRHEKEDFMCMRFPVKKIPESLNFRPPKADPPLKYQISVYLCIKCYES